ncbi:WD40 repeat domain-containing protein, partial [Streptomyces sp. NPDC001215]
MLLAVAAYRARPTAEARGALLSTQAQPFASRLGGHRGPVNALAFSPDDRLLATASSDGTVKLRRLSDHRTIATLTLPGRVRSVAFSPDGHVLAASSTDGPVRLWLTDGRRTETVLPERTAGARAVAFDPRGRTLAVASLDGAVQLWDTGPGHRAGAVLRGHSGTVTALSYAPDGRTIASAGSDRTVRLWSTDTARPLAHRPHEAQARPRQTHSDQGGRRSRRLRGRDHH